MWGDLWTTDNLSYSAFLPFQFWCPEIEIYGWSSQTLATWGYCQGAVGSAEPLAYYLLFFPPIHMQSLSRFSAGFCGSSYVYLLETFTSGVRFLSPFPWSFFPTPSLCLLWGQQHGVALLSFGFCHDLAFRVNESHVVTPLIAKVQPYHWVRKGLSI